MHHRTTFGCMLYIIIRNKRLFVDNGQRFRCCVRIIFPTPSSFTEVTLTSAQTLQSSLAELEQLRDHKTSLKHQIQQSIYRDFL